MAQSGKARISDHFEELTDPRRREPIYPLINVVTIAICAVLSGADDFVAIAQFGRLKKDWLSKFLDLSAGIPSHDRFNAILAAIKPDEFEKCLLSWITAIHEITEGQIVAVDGKTLRGSYDRGNSETAIHMVSAWASADAASPRQSAREASAAPTPSRSAAGPLARWRRNSGRSSGGSLEDSPVGTASAVSTQAQLPRRPRSNILLVSHPGTSDEGDGESAHGQSK